MTNVIPLDDRPQDGERPPTTGMSARRIVTGMTADEFAAPGAPPLPSIQPVGEPVERATPCSAGKEL